MSSSVLPSPSPTLQSSFPFTKPIVSSILQLIDRQQQHSPLSTKPSPVPQPQYLASLKKSVLDVQPFLNDAEERAQRGEDPVRHWLRDLRDVARDAEDLLDEFHYALLDCPRKLKKVRDPLSSPTPLSQSRKRKEVNYPSAIPPQSRRRPRTKVRKLEVPAALFREVVIKWTGMPPTQAWEQTTETVSLSQRLREIVPRFQEVSQKRYALGVKMGGRGGDQAPRKLEGSKKRNRRGTEFDPGDQLLAYGRESDREKVIDLLLSDQGGNISVISLVGIGGVGKTTLARLVYHDRRVCHSFSLRIWVRACGNFDVGWLTRAILELIIPEARGDVGALQGDLKSVLRQHKLLLVLDDIPINVEPALWDSFLAPFTNTTSAKILVTTQGTMTASISHRSLFVNVDCLPEDESWLLFRQFVFDGRALQADTNLMDIGKEIVSKCLGLPLAVKAIGGLLQTETDVNRWNDVLQSDMWELYHPRTEIPAALRLSYTYMPSYLKPCFAYCSLFPGGYLFTKEHLTRLWIAQGFIEPIEGRCVEDISGIYFDELQKRSFIQYASSDEKVNDMFEMHGLIHALSQFASGKETWVWYKHDGEVDDISMEVCHLFQASGEPRVPLDVPLRTYLYIHDCRWYDCQHSTLPRDLFLSLKCLRVLEISCSSLTDLPETIGNLKHLRYLLLKARIRELPESVCKLYNLHTMDLLHCTYLVKLPQAFGNLISLRHLELPKMARDGDPQISYPYLGVGELGSLQTLVGISVGRGGFRIEQLNGLVNLRTLCISGLRNVTNVEGPKWANLEDKKYLQILKLDWCDPTSNLSLPGKYFGQIEVSPVVAQEMLTECVLDSLMPNTNLSELVIKGYDGSIFPRWVGDSTFANLTTMQLDGCNENNCKFLPPLGQLSSLRHLFIARMQGIRYVGREFCHHPEKISTNVFPSLEELKFEQMLEWELWNGVPDGGFPRLRKLTVNYCLKLKRLPTFPSLTTLYLSDSPELSGIPVLPTLQFLDIHNCESLASIPLQQNLSSLQELNVRNCQWLASLIGLHDLLSLEFLSISSCPELQLPSDEQLPLMLHYVDIRGCPYLTEWCQRNGIYHNDVVQQFVNAANSRPTSRNVDGSVVYGREDDKKRVIKLLLSDDCREHDVSVIRIVAAAGIGKTTLIHLVYNNRKVCETFELKRWVSVFENFDVKGLIKAIIESLTGLSCCLSELCELQEVLKEELMEKRFLLVLDNFCNEDQSIWNSLMVSLTAGSKGSVVIMATRNKMVSKITGSVHSYELDLLHENDCWLIFKEIAFGVEDPNIELKLIETGKEIVSRCKGFPLVVKALGGLLHYTAAEKWTNTLSDSGLWDIDHWSIETLSILRLCYDCLPLCLKQCFVYCSLFPKSYIFEKDHIIRLWLSEGFIRAEHGKRVEDIGIQYLDELLFRCFFQYSPIYDAKEEKFMMHDLCHDLAGSVSLPGIDCSRTESNRLCTISEQVDHASFVPWGFQTTISFEPFKEPRDLHTFLLMNRFVLQSDASLFRVENTGILNDIFMNFRSLRTLDLSLTNINELPSSVGNLTQLSYLGLNNTGIKRLPESICSLHSLQTLELEHCNRLLELPKDTKKLVNLRHLNMSKEVGFAFLPLGIGQLTSLQTLSTFHVGGDKQHSTIRELKDLISLRGNLRIGGLENVTSGKDAEDANLKNKEHLITLTLQWLDNGLEFEGDERAVTAGNVLQGLQPHSNLEGLIIRDYFGDFFPMWIGDASFSKLLSITLDNCYQCSILPPLGQLPLLRYLSIWKMDRVQIVGHEFRSSDSVVMTGFPSLEMLKLWEMYEWEEWGGIIDGDFPRLRSLSLSRCFKLRRLPCFTFLLELSVHCCPQLLDLPTLPSLESLKIEGFQNVKSLSLPPLLPSLRILEINNCNQLSSVVGLGHLLSVEQLKITNCPKLKFSPNEDLPFMLQAVHIHRNCPSLGKWCPYGFEEKAGVQGSRKLIRNTQRDVEVH